MSHTDIWSKLRLLLWVGISCAIHILVFRKNVYNEYPVVQRFAITILAVIFTIPMHELLHFIFSKCFCKGQAKILFGKDPMGFPTMKTTYSCDISTWKQVVILLAPFVVMTVTFDIAFAFMDKIPFVLWLISITNSAGCFFDLVAVNKLRKNSV